MWVSKGLTCEVTFEQMPGVREKPFRCQGEDRSGQQTEGSSTCQEKARPVWLERVNEEGARE